MGEAAIVVGDRKELTRPHVPHQARGYPPGVQVRLLPFGEAALEHFVYLEAAADMTAHIEAV